MAVSETPGSNYPATPQANVTTSPASSADSAVALIGQRGKWLALIAALLGWMFDGFEIGMFPLVGHNALKDLLGTEIAANASVATEWFGVIMSVFLIGAATGGVIFGWLGDRIGRVRAMSLSICTYAIFTGLCGFATQAWHIAVLRFVASLGMGGEWALGVALVTEVWPDRSRAFLAGLIGAASNVGMLLVGLLSLVLVSFISGAGQLLLSIGFTQQAVETILHGEGWRLLMVAGALPAFLTVFIIYLVPESHRWQAERAKGTTSHFATRDLWGVLVGAAAAAIIVAIWSPAFAGSMRWMLGWNAAAPLPQWADAARWLATTAGLAIALMGFIFPVARYLRRAEESGSLARGDRKKYVGRMLLGASLAGVALLGTWGSLQWAPKWASALAAALPNSGQPLHAKEYTQIASAAGAVVGTIAAALIGGWIGRRITYALLCVGSFVSLAYMYQFNDAYGTKLLASVFVAGGLTAAFYGWFPLYLPELFPTSIRATSQGFAYNFGRVLSALGSVHTATLTAFFARDIAPDRLELDAFPKAGAALAAIYIIGVFIIWLGPETKGRPLPE
ncbi:MAG: MFS transporter [Pirellulales bacterium]